MLGRTGKIPTELEEIYWTAENEKRRGIMENVNFLCQRCGAPIRMNNEFNTASEHTIAELSLPILHTAKSFPSKAGANYDVITHSFKLRDVVNGGNGFMLVNESVEQETLSHNLRMTAELMDLMSSTSSVDHPVCQDCCESLLSTLENELEKVESDLRDYNVLRNKLRLEEKNRHSTVGRAEMNDMIKKLDEMKENEKDLLLELKRLQIEEEVADRELAELEKERDGLVSEEQRYLKEYAKYKQETLCLEDETRSVECQLRYAQTQLEKVRNTTVFSAAFHIWIANDFGVINGFRLGRLYEQPVEWWEINAAWGQTALLLSSMAAKRSFVFNKYQIVPYGNFSCIKIIDDNKTLNLYGSGSFRTGIFSDRSFDQGMVAFLDCLQQLKAEMERTDDLRLPHGIDKDKGRIDDGVGNWYSIKIQLNSEEQWTRALRYMLVNLQLALKYVSSLENEEEDTN